MKKLYLLAFILFFTSEFLSAQVLDPPYIRSNSTSKTKTENSAYLTHYYLPQLENTSLKQGLDSTIAAINLFSPKKLSQFSDCIYFDDVMHHCFNYSGERFVWNTLFQERSEIPSRFPPSLRFSTDASKNNIDSVFSMHLFPTVPLEKYAEPFYFKKFEVTNAEYREFVNFVRDSVVMRILANDGYEDVYLLAKYSEFDPDTNELPLHLHFSDDFKLNKKTEIHWNSETSDYKEALSPIYLPAEERYWHRKEIDVRKLLYEYYSDSLGNPIPFPWKWDDRNTKNIIKDIINVYPDTLTWVHDFPYNIGEPMTNMYFWHPSYDDYPVVGISWRQAKAYLNWKTIEEQKKLDAKGIKLKVVYDLPTEIEWEIAATSEMEDGKINSYGKNFQALADNSWLTDLMLDTSQLVDEKVKVVTDSTCEEIIPVDYSNNYYGVISPSMVDGVYVRDKNQPTYYYTDTTITKNEKEYQIKTTFYYWSKRRINFLNENSDQEMFWNVNYSPDNYVFTSPANLQIVKKTTPDDNIFLRHYNRTHDHKIPVIDNTEILKQIDAAGISFMGGNVSEWLNEDYSGWRPAFLTRLKLLHSINSIDAQLEYQKEFYFDTFNSKNGKLVRGGNWYDERNSSVLGKNPAGMNAKCFVDPESAHCTLGFRYVIHVTTK